MPFRKDKIRRRAECSDGGSMISVNTRSSGQSTLSGLRTPRDEVPPLIKGQAIVTELQLADGHVARLESHPAHRLSTVAATPEMVRIDRFRRTISASLHQHSLIVTTLTSSLLVALFYLDAITLTFYTGASGYLIGTFTSAIVFHHAIRNATYRDELDAKSGA